MYVRNDDHGKTRMFVYYDVLSARMFRKVSDEFRWQLIFTRPMETIAL